ncbi:MAG: UbiH/UbiF/VisC/COQ6 family ubiquinone biosynthesis hydroxylase [bacterium]|nr:2-octaprenyl-3-methyl-6-methoxy-1,4-benzoquinol hydroxylase [Gammaproteobacteria bacterium]HIL94431.1 2-octaprenyl-3-methyl-6-methoxy-1,4-benzoquinol hydroxylase [Pseudomonadales bacterium]
MASNFETINSEGYFDVVICGGGLVGLALANALKESDLKIAIIDAQGRPADFTQNSPESGNYTLSGFDLDSGYAPRVSALNAATIKMLKRLGAWQDVTRSCAIKKMSVRDSTGSASIDFDASEANLDSLGYIVENREVLSGLANQLDKDDHVQQFWNTRLESLEQSGSGYSLQLASDRQLDCQLLIGADGGNSRIRQLNHLQTVRWNYGQDAVVSTITTEKEHDGVARQWFTPEGPLAFLPLEDSRLCSIVWSTHDADSLMGTESGVDAVSEALCCRLSEASEGELGDVLGIDQRFSFPLVQQHSLRYVKSNLALIGDAAHTIHPLAGQGANLGFADAAALASELMQSRFSDANIGDLSLLRSYERARQPQNLLMTSLMEAFKRLYATDDPGVNWLRNTGMKFVNDSKLLKSLVVRMASGL